MRQFTTQCACPMCYPCSRHSKLSGFPISHMQQVSGISTTAPQATGDPTSTCQDTHATSWVVSLPDTKRTGQSCIVFPSLWLSWQTKGKKDSGGHCGLVPALSPLDVCCTGATALELSLPFACVISRASTATDSEGHSRR